MTMSTKILSLTAALVGSAIAVIVAWRAAAATEAAEAARAASVAAHARTETDLVRLNEAAAAIERARSEAQAELAARQTMKQGASMKRPANGGTPPTPRPAALHPSEAIARDPKLQVMQLASERARFETTYGPLLKKLRLTADQITTLRDAHVRAEEQKGDIAAIARQQTLKPDDPVLVKLSREANNDLREVQMQVLGSENFEALQGYLQTLPARAIVERFAGAMAIADKPVTAEQAERLTEIVAAASGPLSNGRTDSSATDWSVVDEHAASVLSPEQLALFKRIEPIGGGQSRWMANFDRAMKEARKSLAHGKPGG
jgi:hypothetical protein